MLEHEEQRREDEDGVYLVDFQNLFCSQNVP